MSYCFKEIAGELRRNPAMVGGLLPCLLPFWLDRLKRLIKRINTLGGKVKVKDALELSDHGVFCHLTRWQAKRDIGRLDYGVSLAKRVRFFPMG